MLAALALAVAAASVLGPLVLGLMRYRTSPTTLNQLLGSDAGALRGSVRSGRISAGVLRLS